MELYGLTANNDRSLKGDMIYRIQMGPASGTTKNIMIANDYGLHKGDMIYRKLLGSAKGTTKVTSGKLGYHYGIYIGNYEVVHFTRAGVQRSSLDEFASGKEVSKKKISSFLTYFVGEKSKEKIVKTALYYCENPQKLKKYDLLGNYCEHFVIECATYMIPFSNQVLIAALLVFAFFLTVWIVNKVFDYKYEITETCRKLDC